jgi:catechol 2,3-dioxygenase-like lactoylglutathione lyase family enzyme
MIKGLHHIVLFCRDPEASRAWYERAGFHYLHGYDGMHWLAFGDAQVMLHPLGEADTDAAGGGHARPVLHVAVDSADAAFAQVVSQGLTPIDHQRPGARIQGPVVREWGDREFELCDPDGQWWAYTEVAG